MVSNRHRQVKRSQLTQHAIIIGGGIVGISCAIRLQEKGISTLLIERENPLRGASWGNAGHVAVEQRPHQPGDEHAHHRGSRDLGHAALAAHASVDEAMASSTSRSTARYSVSPRLAPSLSSACTSVGIAFKDCWIRYDSLPPSDVRRRMYPRAVRASSWMLPAGTVALSTATRPSCTPIVEACCWNG